MSKDFDSALHDLYARAARADAQVDAADAGFSAPQLVARARHNRRRAAATTAAVATLSVVAVGFAGFALAGSRGAVKVPPAGWDATFCGWSIDDLATDNALTSEVLLAETTVAPGEALAAEVTVVGGPSTAEQAWLYYLVVQDGVVVGVGSGVESGEPGATFELNPSERTDVTTAAAIELTACGTGTEPTSALPTGDYELYGILKAMRGPVGDGSFKADGSDLAGPWPFTVAAEEPTTEPTETPERPVVEQAGWEPSWDRCGSPMDMDVVNTDLDIWNYGPVGGRSAAVVGAPATVQSLLATAGADVTVRAQVVDAWAVTWVSDVDGGPPGTVVGVTSSTDASPVDGVVPARSDTTGAGLVVPATMTLLACDTDTAGTPLPPGSYDLLLHFVITTADGRAEDQWGWSAIDISES